MQFLHQFKPQTQKPTAYSLIDVGRDTVRTVVILMLPGNQEPQVVGYGQAETGGHDITGGRIEAGAVTRSVNEALVQAEDSTETYIDQKIVPDDAIFALAGRATVGKLFTVKQLRPTPTDPISAQELENLRIRAERLVRQGLPDSSVEAGQWQPLAVTDAGVWVDDHLVLGAAGLTGRELSFAVYGVAVQAAALRAVEALAARLDLAIANVVAAPQALASLAPHTEAIILDIGASGTNICLLRNEVLVAADWIPFGGEFFTQALTKTMKIEPERAKRLKHALAAGQLEKKDSVQIETHLVAPRRRWYESLLAALTDLSYDTPLPRRVYLTGGGSQLPGLDRLLRSDPAPFDAAPEVAPLSAQPFSALKDLTDSLDYNRFALALSLAIGLPE